MRRKYNIQKQKVNLHSLYLLKKLANVLIPQRKTSAIQYLIAQGKISSKMGKKENFVHLIQSAGSAFCISPGKVKGKNICFASCRSNRNVVQQEFAE